MFDDLRDSNADDNFDEFDDYRDSDDLSDFGSFDSTMDEDANDNFSDDKKPRPNRRKTSKSAQVDMSFGMTAPQRFLLSILFFFMMLILSTLFLLVSGTVVI